VKVRDKAEAAHSGEIQGNSTATTGAAWRRRGRDRWFVLEILHAECSTVIASAEKQSRRFAIWRLAALTLRRWATLQTGGCVGRALSNCSF